MSRYVPLWIGGRVVAYGSETQVLDLCARLRERGIDATVPEACDGCGRHARNSPAAGLCVRCYRRVKAGRWVKIDYETEAERRGGAEPE